VIALFTTAIFNDFVNSFASSSFAVIFIGFFLVMAIGGGIGLRHDNQLGRRENDIRHTPKNIIITSILCGLAASSLITLAIYLLIYTRRHMSGWIAIIVTGAIVNTVVLLLYGPLLLIARINRSKK
jgi:MFS family permease